MSGTASLFSGSPLDRPSSMPAASRTPVRKSGEILRRLGEIEPQIFADRVATFLRMIHPQKTAQCVEADARGRLPAKTVAKWLEGASAPNGQNYNELLGLYGMELFVYVNPDASTAEMREAARIAHQARIERQNAELRQRLTGQLAEIWGRT